MSGASRGVAHPRFRSLLRADGILELVRAPRVAIKLEDVIASNHAIATLMAGHRRPLMVNAGAARPVGRAGSIELARRNDLCVPPLDRQHRAQPNVGKPPPRGEQGDANAMTVRRRGHRPRLAQRVPTLTTTPAQPRSLRADRRADARRPGA